MDRFFGSNIKINLLVQNITFLRFLICKCQPHMGFLRALMKELLIYFYDKQKVCQNIFYISSHRNKNSVALSRV